MITNSKFSAFCAIHIVWLVSITSQAKESTSQSIPLEVGSSSSKLHNERVSENSFTPGEDNKLHYLPDAYIKLHDWNTLLPISGNPEYDEAGNELDNDKQNNNIWSKRSNWNNLQGMWGKRDNDDENEKRNNWNNLSGMWGKRNKWNNLSGMWGKRNKWNELNGMWGKRSKWNELNGMWGKRNDWNNLSGMWGKKNDWNNLSGMWGKRNNWNNLSGMWGKRNSNTEINDTDLIESKRNNWNSFKGAWGKRSNWNNLPEMWTKKLINEAQLAEDARKRTRWNNLNGMWGKRSYNSQNQDIFTIPESPDGIEDIQETI